MKTLEGIKIAIFDFDDTLALHKNQNYVKDRENAPDLDTYFLKAFQNPRIFYRVIEPCIAPEGMLSLVGYCRLNKIKMFCVSKMRYSLHQKAKEAFIEDSYGYDIKFVLASSVEKKLEVVRVLSKAYNLKYEEILYVDDCESIVKELKGYGANAISLNEVSSLEVIKGTSLVEYMDD